jgi:hypothetical protein
VGSALESVVSPNIKAYSMILLNGLLEIYQYSIDSWFGLMRLSDMGKQKTQKNTGMNHFRRIRCR